MTTRHDYVPGLAPASMVPPSLLERLATEKILAVVTLDHAEDAAPLARALLDGGVRAIELAWRTADALAALAAIKQEAPEMLLGVGTLLTAEQVRLARDAGADFGVSPGLSPAVVDAARRCSLPYAPGVQTASDIQAAIEHGCRCLKFFPAESAGGLAHLRHLHAPFAHLGLRYIPLGGINEQNAPAYLAEPAVVAVGGSWIAPVALVRQRAWAEIQHRAAEARALVERAGKNLAA